MQALLVMTTAIAPQASVIIVNWNGREHLPDCLDSLAAQRFREFEAIVVDNGSTDGSVTLIRERYPWVRLVSLAENTGFAAGNNRGFAVARGAYLVTLNNDTWAEPDWLARLVAVADAHPHVGMVGCRICSFSDPDVIDSLGLGICRDGMSRGRYRDRNWSSLHMAEVEDILMPSACAALYRRAMIEEVGGFDEDFFAYAEDSDLGLRGRLAGWEALLASDAVVFHKYSQTAGSFSPLKVYLVERNHYWVALKCFPTGALAMLPFFTAVRYFKQFCQVLSGCGSGGEFRGSNVKARLAGAFLRALGATLRGAPGMLGKRRRIMSTRRHSGRDFAKLMRRHGMSFDELLDNE